MKGPGLKINMDVRRLWECPETGKSLKAPGHVTQMVSPFTRERVMMKMVEDLPSKRRQPSLDEILDHMYVPSEETDSGSNESTEEQVAEATEIKPSEMNSEQTKETDSKDSTT